MYHAIVNVNLIEESVIQIKSGITINVDAGIKNIIYVKEIKFGIALLITAQLLVLSINLIKYQAKQKHLLLHYFTINKLKKFYITNIF